MNDQIRKALIVDDNEQNLYLLEVLLKNSGFDVLKAENGQVALDILAEQEVNIVISDILMPVMDGFQLCKNVKSSKQYSRIPFVFYTATYISAKDEEFALSLGAERFLRKPADFDLVLQVVKELLAESPVSTSRIDPRLDQEKEFLQLYSKRLVDKLEQKVDDLSKTEERLRQKIEEVNRLNSDLKAFNYSVSNALRVPLRHISGFIKMIDLELECNDQEKVDDYISVINSSVQNMNSMLDDLLQLSHASLDEMRLSQVDLSLAGRVLMKRVLGIAPDKKVEYRIGEKMQCYACENLLFVVLENLLENAVKFSAFRENPVVEFGQCEDQEQDTFFIRDNGIGFSESEKENLFLPFHAFHSRESMGGQGLGLAISKRIIDRHGGKIWCEGKVDGGATFYFSLPGVKS